MSVLSHPWLDEQSKALEIDRPLAALLTASITLAFVAADPRLWHWFVLPIAFCGLLIGPDAIRWLRGRYDLYDPKGIVGALGYYFFFLTPLFFVSGGAEMSQVEGPSDWRPWAGYFALLNIAGLILYFVGQNVGFRTRPRGIRRPVHKAIRARRTINIDRAWPWFVLFGLVATISQAYFLYRSGGIVGIIQQAITIQETGQIETTGLGLFEIPGRALPVILLVYASLIRQKRCLPQASRTTVYALIATLSALQFLLVGFAGSRSATIWSLFWLIGIIHYYWRPLDRRSVFLGLAVLIAFLYIYGFYKSGGTRAITTLAEGGSFRELEEDTGRTFQGLLISDLSRVDVQSYQLYILQNPNEYDLRWGKTYLSAFTRSIPSWLWQNRPPDSEKVVAATELFKGRGSYIPGDLFRNSSKVMGLAGEAMLNFGIWSAPIPFALWGYLVGRHRRALLTWHATDVRRFLAPFITLLLFTTLFSDLENTASTFVGKASYVTLLILLASKRSVADMTCPQEIST